MWYCGGRRKRRKRFPHELFKLLKVLSLFQIVVSRQCVIGVKYKQALSLKGKDETLDLTSARVARFGQRTDFQRH